MKEIVNKKNKFRQGFTLVETLITIFIVTLIGLAIINFQIDIFSLNKISSDNLNAQTDARNTLKTIGAELRSLSPSNAGAYPLAITATSSLAFYVDTDNDSLKEKIHYFQSGNTLKRSSIKPTGTPLTYDPANEKITTLINNLANGTSSVFYYYDKNYDGTGDPLTEPIDIPAVRLIKINIMLGQVPNIITVTTQISPRNLKDNL